MMHKIKSIKINAALNGFKTTLSILFPLITYPYVTRVLGAHNLGTVNYVQSIVSYFSLLAALGISTYATREGAKVRDDTGSIQVLANEIFSINLITTILAYGLLFATFLLMPSLRQYFGLACILSLSILFTTIGIDWINNIYEDFLYITIRSIVVQILNLVLLFIFVKKSKDYYIYAFLIVFMQIVIGISNFLYCRKYIKVKPIFHTNFKKHISPMLILFANSVAVTLYCNSDITMLGYMLSPYNVGIYSIAVKVYSMIRSLIASLFLVTIPRLSNYHGKMELDSYNRLIQQVTEGVILFLLPAVCGLIALSKPIVLILGGQKFVEASSSLQILSVALLFAIEGGIITNCINISSNKEKDNLIATTIAALINVVLNLFMIPTLKQNGAAITTVIAEVTVIVVCLVKNKSIMKIFNYKSLGKTVFQALLGCLAVAISYMFSSSIVNNAILVCGSTFAVTILLYGVLLIYFKNEFLLGVIRRVTRKFGRGR